MRQHVKQVAPLGADDLLHLGHLLTAEAFIRQSLEELGARIGSAPEGTRIGFRVARFEVDGFFLNGRRLQLFGLNRHELYPYVGGAMPQRVLRHESNCNIMRCSHYPQSEAFLDAGDELGLMVWEEIPGWQYVGDAAWKELAIRDAGDMVRRDRNHLAIVIWGVRVNESQNDPALYARTKQVANSLDDSRPTSGSMTPSSTNNWQQEWHQDVFAFDDYHSAPDGSVGIRNPLPGVPYMLAEAVGSSTTVKARDLMLDIAAVGM